MQQSIILFLALLTSILFITATITWTIRPAHKNTQREVRATVRFVLVLLFCFLWSFFYYLNLPHKCIDTSHKMCDSACVCDGLNCN